VLFVTVALIWDLALYGDGSIFSYGIAIEEGWKLHWHNIPNRVFVYLYAHVPAEMYVAWTGDAKGGIAVYGFLFFVAPLIGLALTRLTDNTCHRVFFNMACVSTASLCPLVFGFPTEMWIAHSLFWPTLTLAHRAPSSPSGAAALTSAMAALILTHEGAVVFALAIVATLLPNGARSYCFLRAIVALIAAMLVWGVLRAAFPPDPYYAKIVPRIALNFIDVRSLAGDLLQVLGTALAMYLTFFVIFRRTFPDNAHVIAAISVAVVLAIYWWRFDYGLHTSERYALRTALLITTPIFGATASLLAQSSQSVTSGMLGACATRTATWVRSVDVRAAMGALLVIYLVHSVETVKFVRAWSNYKSAIVALTAGHVSDPELGGLRFASSRRIPGDLNRLAWQSTTQYLSLLLAPNFEASRIVVDPDAGYYWLGCQIALGIENEESAIPREDRHLIRLLECRHRRN